MMTPSKIKDITDKREATWTARELIQHFTGSWGNQSTEKLKKLEERIDAPEAANCYSDGSLKILIGNPWAIRGLSVWWPNICIASGRKEDACNGPPSTN